MIKKGGGKGTNDDYTNTTTTTTKTTTARGWTAHMNFPMSNVVLHVRRNSLSPGGLRPPTTKESNVGVTGPVN